MSAKRDDFRESQDSMNALAVDTGGKFFRNNNDIKAGLRDMMEENSAYKCLEFSLKPQSGTEGTTRSKSRCAGIRSSRFRPGRATWLGQKSRKKNQTWIPGSP